MRVVLHRRRNCEENSSRKALATAFSWRTIVEENNAKTGKTGMTSRLEAYRVQAYNTAKLSENKMHDDTVARRFGFNGGLVPGVDVMAYMMHLPVRKWGRAFLERGLIEARFVKPVYDGETADVTGEESGGVLSIEVESHGQLCASGTASLPASAPSLSIADFQEAAPVSERRPVNEASYELGKWLGTVPRAWAGEAATEYLTDVRERDPIYARDGLGHPGLLQRVMNKVLVDNAILGPWIHVGSRMQLLAASAPGDELTARARVTGNYEKKGHRFVELDALVVANGSKPLAHCQHIAIYQPREQAAA
jgi:acyl dehydratase